MTFTHSIGAGRNEYFALKINDNKKGIALQERYDEGDRIQTCANTSREKARGRAMMRRAVKAARKIAA